MDEKTKFTTLVVWKKLVLFFLTVIYFLRYLGAMVGGVTGACPFFFTLGRVYGCSLKLMFYSGLWQDYPKVLLSAIYMTFVV